MKNFLLESPVESHKKVGEIIEDVRVCMLTTVREPVALTSRPMVVLEVDERHDLWFFASTMSDLMVEIRLHPVICLTFASSARNKYLSLCGRGVEVDDRVKMETLWRPEFEAWYKEGLETAGLCLLKVTVQSAEFWDTPTSPVVKLQNLVRSFVREPPVAGRHEKVDLQH